jgi:hypothetical protein
MDHDRLFKRLLSEFFAEFLELFVPDLAEQLDGTELVPLDKELWGDDAPVARHEVDLLVRARVRGEPSHFLIHVEAQAQHQPDFARRMFRYFSRLHEAHDAPIYPIAVLAHLRPKRPAPSVYELAAAGQPVLRFEFRVVQLNQLSWQAFRDHPNPVAAALMARMGIDPADRARVKWECYQMLATLRLAPKRAQRIVAFIEGYLRLDEQEQRVFDAAYEVSAPAVKEVVMEYANQWFEKGERRGLAAGRLQASRDLLQRLLTRRFGPLPEARREALAALPVETVEAIAESIFELTSLDDLDRWLAPDA